MSTSDAEIEKVLKALANRRRIAIVRFLRRRKETAVNRIAEHIKLSLWATSRHLSRLHAVNIVERDQRGLFMYYRLSREMPASTQQLITTILQ